MRPRRPTRFTAVAAASRSGSAAPSANAGNSLGSPWNLSPHNPLCPAAVPAQIGATISQVHGADAGAVHAARHLAQYSDSDLAAAAGCGPKSGGRLIVGIIAAMLVICGATIVAGIGRIRTSTADGPATVGPLTTRPSLSRSAAVVHRARSSRRWWTEDLVRPAGRHRLHSPTETAPGPWRCSESSGPMSA